MKRHLQLIILLNFLLASQGLYACSCVVEGPFLKLAPSAELVAMVKVIEYTSFAELKGEKVPMSMSVEVLEVLKGNEKRDTITVWGNNGMMCRPYLFAFSPESTWIMAYGEDGTIGHTAAKEGDYAVSDCGEQFLPVEDGIIGGFIHRYDYEEMDIIKLRTKLNMVIRTESELDKAKQLVIDDLYWQKIDTVGVFECFSSSREKNAKVYQPTKEMKKDAAYDGFMEYLRGCNEDRVIFVFWQEKGAMYIQQIDACLKHESIKLEHNDLFEFYTNNQETLWEEKPSSLEIVVNPKTGKKRYLRKKETLLWTNITVQLFLGYDAYINELDSRLYEQGLNKTLKSYIWAKNIEQEMKLIENQHDNLEYKFNQFKKRNIK